MIAKIRRYPPQLILGHFPTLRIHISYTAVSKPKIFQISHRYFLHMFQISSKNWNLVVVPAQINAICCITIQFKWILNNLNVLVSCLRGCLCKKPGRLFHTKLLAYQLQLYNYITKTSFSWNIVFVWRVCINLYNYSRTFSKHWKQQCKTSAKQCKRFYFLKFRILIMIMITYKLNHFNFQLKSKFWSSIQLYLMIVVAWLTTNGRHQIVSKLLSFVIDKIIKREMFCSWIFFYWKKKKYWGW